MNRWLAAFTEAFSFGYDYHNGRVVAGWGWIAILAGAALAAVSVVSGCAAPAVLDASCDLGAVDVSRRGDTLHVAARGSTYVRVTFAGGSLRVVGVSPADSGDAYWADGALHVLADSPLAVAPVPSSVAYEYVAKCAVRDAHAGR